MNPGLERIAGALGELGTSDLGALRHAAERSPQVVPGLLAWLEHAVGWELDRRHGHTYRLAEPTEAIPPEEVAHSIAALVLIAAAFESAPSPGQAGTEAIIDLLDATKAMLQTTSDRLH